MPLFLRDVGPASAVNGTALFLCSMVVWDRCPSQIPGTPFSRTDLPFDAGTQWQLCPRKASTLFTIIPPLQWPSLARRGYSCHLSCPLGDAKLRLRSSEVRDPLVLPMGIDRSMSVARTRQGIDHQSLHALYPPNDDFTPISYAALLNRMVITGNDGCGATRRDQGLWSAHSRVSACARDHVAATGARLGFIPAPKREQSLLSWTAGPPHVPFTAVLPFVWSKTNMISICILVFSFVFLFMITMNIFVVFLPEQNKKRNKTYMGIKIYLLHLHISSHEA